MSTLKIKLQRSKERLAQRQQQQQQEVTLPPLNFHLDYLGGPVISNAQVVSVLWGPNVDPTIVNMIPDFFSAILQSKYVDWLCEYSTYGLPQPTTNQIIGRGNFVTQKAITPFNTSSLITDSTSEPSELHTELAQQIDAGNLPPPEFDDQGYTNTVYVITLPEDVDVLLDGADACQFGIGGYHSFFLYKNKPLLYAVIFTCFDAITPENLVVPTIQSTMAHEIAESITDPMGPPLSVAYYPNGWVDIDNFTGLLAGFEIADLGQIYQGQVVIPPSPIPFSTGDATINIEGKWYDVAYLWSNSQGIVITTNPNLPKGPSIKGPEHVKKGHNITLKAEGDACAPFQWYRNGRLIKVTEDRKLKIKHFNKEDQGKYIVRGFCTEFSEVFELKH
jgi:hypothetical protein